MARSTTPEMASTLKSKIDFIAMEPPVEAVLALFPIKNFFSNSHPFAVCTEITRITKSKTLMSLAARMTPAL